MLKRCRFFPDATCSLKLCGLWNAVHCRPRAIAGKSQSAEYSLEAGFFDLVDTWENYPERAPFARIAEDRDRAVQLLRMFFYDA